MANYTVEEFIFHIEEENHRSIVTLLHDCLMSVQGMKSAIKWGLPFYQRNQPVAYINIAQKKVVELCFWNGHQLASEHSILDEKNRKQIAGITFFELNEEQIDQMLAVLNDAIMLDEGKH